MTLRIPQLGSTSNFYLRGFSMLPLFIFRFFSLFTCGLAFCPTNVLAELKSGQEFEPPPVFHASKILPPQILTGPGYRIHDLVYNDGVDNRYELTTDYGRLAVESTDLLMIRLQEFKALRAMEELKRTDVYATALKNAATAPLDLAKNLVFHPIDTVSGIGTGVGKFFGNIGHSIWGKPSEQEEGVVKTILGFDTIKRKYAYEFGVDPYSNNEILQNRLKEVSWTAFAGNLTVRVAFLAIPDVAGLVVRGTGFSEGMNKLLRDKSPAELKDLNAEILKRMAVHRSIAEVFLEHPKFSPSQTTYLVGALERMEGVADREIFIQVAALAHDESTVFFRRRQAELMAGYHTNVSPVRRLIRLGKGSFVQKQDGKVVGIFPIDHLVWTKQVARTEALISRAITQLQNVPAKELWISGTMSPVARKNLEASGWTIKEDVLAQLTLKS